MAGTLMRKVAAVSFAAFLDLLVAAALGFSRWPSPLMGIYTALSLFQVELPMCKNVHYASKGCLRFRALLPILPAYFQSAPWWLHIVVATLLLWWLVGLGASLVRTIGAGIALLYCEDKDAYFILVLTWVGTGLLDWLNPAAALGALFFHINFHPWATLVLSACSIGSVVIWQWLTQKVSEGRFGTAVAIMDWLYGWQYRRMLKKLTWLRLNQDASWVFRGLLANYPLLDGSKARAWIPQRVEQERNKAAEYQLDCSVRADNLKQTPHFDLRPDDTADLEFLCSEKTTYFQNQRRPFGEALVLAGAQNESVYDLQKQEVVQILAHLSYTNALSLKAGDRRRLAGKLLCMCRSSIEQEQHSLDVDELEASLTGLANLARGNKELGSFLKGERLFSIIAGLLNPSTSLAASCMTSGERLLRDFGQDYEHHDRGYSQPELSGARKKLRASTSQESTRAPSSGTPEAHFRPALPPVISVMDADIPEDATLRVNLSCLWSSTRVFLKHFELEKPTKDVARKFRLGAWFRLLTAAVRLISSLSTEESNHEWLLAQGALQAVKRVLQSLPADRMRTAHQEAALFIYQLFENQEVHAIISRSPALKATAHAILIELRAIDSDLFGEGWGTRIGSQLYQELLSVEQEPPAESGGTKERKNGTRRRRSSKTRVKSTVKDDKKTGGECGKHEVVSEGADCRAVNASATFSSYVKPEKEAVQQRKVSRRSVKCSREGCHVEREPGVRLMVCAGCKRAR